MRSRLRVGVIGMLSDSTPIKSEEMESGRESGMKRKLMSGLKLNYKHGRRKGTQPEIRITQTNPTIHLDSEPVSIELYVRGLVTAKS